MVLILAEQVRKHSKENTTLSQHKYSPVYCYKDEILARQKKFVEDKSLVALNKILFYIVA